MESPRADKIKILWRKTNMKKVLALVLAVAMLSTMAFATTADHVVDEDNSVDFGGRVAPGESLYVYYEMTNNELPNSPVDSGEGWNAEITSANYSITNQKWTQGKDLLAGLEFDDKNNQLKINIKEDYTLKQPKSLIGSFTLKGKGKGSFNKDKPHTIKVTVDVTVGNWKQEVKLDADKDMTFKYDGTLENAYKNVADNKLIFSHADPSAAVPSGAVDTDELYNNAVQKFSGSNYGTVVINCADEGDTEVTFRAYKNDEFFLYNDAKANNALLKDYADQDAEISFLNFPSGQVLNSTATIRFYKDEESHVYVMKDGKLTSEVKWDDDEDAFVLKTRTLGNYVFSDKALPFNVEATGNPDTGANDVVGIATALAAVALVSAAAVSLKK